jgi:hypothetical protein
MELRIKTFLQFLRESVAAQPSLHGSFWYNGKTGEFRDIDRTDARYDDTGNVQKTIDSATYHAGYVAKNPHVFGLTEDQIVAGLHEYESKFSRGPEQSTLGQRALKNLQNGMVDTHPVVDSMVMKNGWVRVVGSSNGKLWVQGKTSNLHRLARHVREAHPNVTSMSMDVHGAREEYGHLDSSIQGMAHVLEGHEDIDNYVASGGAPNRRYTRIIRVPTGTR